MTDRKTMGRIVTGAAQPQDGALSLSCVRAFKLAKTHKIPVKLIGRACNEANVKICACQLGCFK